MRNIRTDMACELRENAGDIAGITSEEWSHEGAVMTLVEVLDEQGAKSINRAIGKYFTIDYPSFDVSTKQECQCREKIAVDFISKIMHNPKSVLIAGLGNRAVSADCVGPLVCEKVFVTRHIIKHIPNMLEQNTRDICAVAPGVLGVTGIESAEIIKGLVEKIKPDLVIAVDALAARKISRLGCSLQITDTGISPGSGVGNNRSELSSETLGIPVIAIGVPMVASAHTVAADLLEQTFSSADEEHLGKMIEAVFGSEDAGAFVTPKDVDILSKQVSDMISRILNSALNGHVDNSEFIDI